MTLEAAPTVLRADSLSIELPKGWSSETAGVEDPVLLFARSASDSSGANPNTRNLVVTREALSPLLAKLFNQDPVFFLQVSLLQTYRSMNMIDVRRRTINGVSGVFISSFLREAKTEVSNVQFFFLRGERLFLVVYSCQYSERENAIPAFEKSLSTLRWSKK
jgi:hypothetical protein